MKLHDLKSPKARRIARRCRSRIGGKAARPRPWHQGKSPPPDPGGFEGGQCRFSSASQLKGFTNPFRVEYTPVNLDALVALGSVTSTRRARPRGLARKKDLIKVLGRGTVTTRSTSRPTRSPRRQGRHRSGRRYHDRNHLPFAVRPPASGNQHQNR